MKMFHVRSLLLIALLVLPAPVTSGARPAGDVLLGWQIANQGNRALAHIRAQTRFAAAASLHLIAHASAVTGVDLARANLEERRNPRESH